MAVFYFNLFFTLYFMLIQWFGQTCFKITVKSKIGTNSIILTDPYHNKNGLKKINFGADIVTLSSLQNQQLATKYSRGTAETPQPFIIKSPGEYEVNNVFVYGLNCCPPNHSSPQTVEAKHNFIYVIKAENITLTHLGNLQQKELSAAQLELIENTDILLVPVGGASISLNAKMAADLISQIEPRIIIPMQYKLPQLKNNLEPVDKFIKEMGNNQQTLDKLNINSKDLPVDKTTLIILSSQNK